MQRDLDLVVEGYAKTATNLDDTLDQIGKEIEVAMAGDIDLNSLADDSYLSSVEIGFPPRFKPLSESYGTTIR